MANTSVAQFRVFFFFFSYSAPLSSEMDVMLHQIVLVSLCYRFRTSIFYRKDGKGKPMIGFNFDSSPNVFKVIIENAVALILALASEESVSMSRG